MSDKRDLWYFDPLQPSYNCSSSQELRMSDKRDIFQPPSGPLKLQQFTRTKDIWQKGLMILQPSSAILQLQQFTRTKDAWQKEHMIFQPSSASFKLQQYTRTENVSHCIFVGLFWNLDYKRLQEQQPKKYRCQMSKVQGRNKQHMCCSWTISASNIMQSLCDLIFNQQMQIPVFA